MHVVLAVASMNAIWQRYTHLALIVLALTATPPESAATRIMNTLQGGALMRGAFVSIPSSSFDANEPIDPCRSGINQSFRAMYSEFEPRK